MQEDVRHDIPLKLPVRVGIGKARGAGFMTRRENLSPDIVYAAGDFPLNAGCIVVSDPGERAQAGSDPAGACCFGFKEQVFQRVAPRDGQHLRMVQLFRYVQQRRVEQHTNEQAFLPLHGEAVMKLPCVDEKDAFLRQQDGAAVDFIMHPSAENVNHFYVIMPVADGSHAGIVRQLFPEDFDGKSGDVVMDDFG